MQIPVQFIYSLALVFFIVDARVRREAESEPVTKYYLDGSGIVMECVPPQEKTCHWATNTGNTYFMQSLPPYVLRNSSDSCTITFIRPSIYHSLIWACQLENQEKAIETYKILEGLQPTAPKFKNEGGFLSLEDNIDWAREIKINCSTVLEGFPAPTYNINATGLRYVEYVSNNSVILHPDWMETEAKLTCTIEQQFLRNPLTTTITLQLQDKPRNERKAEVSYDDNMNEQVFKYTFVSNPRLTGYEWSFSNTSDQYTEHNYTSVDREKRYTSLKVFNEENGHKKSLSLVIKDYNEMDMKRYFYLKLTNAKGFLMLGPVNSAALTASSALLVLLLLFVHLGSSSLYCRKGLSTI